MRNYMRNYINKKNVAFSRICGEDFTNKEVVAAHMGFVVVVAVCMLI